MRKSLASPIRCFSDCCDRSPARNKHPAALAHFLEGSGAIYQAGIADQPAGQTGHGREAKQLVSAWHCFSEPLINTTAEAVSS